MGHERIGFLPKTRQWNAIVNQLSMFDNDIGTATKVAEMTLSAIRKAYEQMPYDESVVKAIKFLTALSLSAKQEDQVKYLQSHGFSVDEKLSPFSLMSGARDYITTERDSLETNKLTRDAVLEAMATYQKSHSGVQLSLFDDTAHQSVWNSVGSGSAFCELARAFFAAFTDRQIKYYVDRSAASVIDDITKLDSFSKAVSSQTEAISHHAFGTSKIMQSFAAGWFNKHADNEMPTDSEVIGFLRTSFGKMREEFRREAEDR